MTTTSSTPNQTSENSPEFSVIIPTFHRPQMLAEAVASVIAQTVQSWECIIVDDGGGESELQAIAEVDARIRLIRRDVPGGPAAARNTGIALAQGTAITFLDDDDWYVPQRLDLARRALYDPRIDIAICWSVWDQDSPGGRTLNGNVADTILDRTVPHLAGTAIRLASLLTFNESYAAAEDLDWWLRSAQQATLATIEEVGCRLRRHHSRRLNGTDVAGRIAASEQLLADHATYFSAHRRALAFRFARMGVMAASSDQRQLSIRYFRRSIRTRPSAVALKGLLRQLLPAPKSRRDPLTGSPV
ncbi:MAG: glycosyltransferase family 2 protein [Actinomycetes bacterium]